VRAKVRELPCPFEVRESGGGLHLYANLKEAYENGTEHFIRAERLRTQLTELLCGDPAPNHSAALMRVLGSHNTKYGEPIEVARVAEGEPVDLTDVEAFLDLFPRPLFEVKEEYTSFATENIVSLDVPIRAIDTEAVLADMPTNGEGVNAVSYRLLRALLVREGHTPDEAVSIVVDAIMAMAARVGLADANGNAWTREEEVRASIARMNWVLGRLQSEHWKDVDAGRIDADVPPGWLWGDEHAKWCEACAEGLRPNVFRNGSGWYVRRPPHSAKNGGDPEPPPRADPPPKSEGPKKNIIRAIPFKAFNEATLPPREYAFGKHYQIGQVTCSMGQDGAGKSTLSIAELISMALCRDTLGEQPSERRRVWIHNADDDTQEIYRRIAAHCRKLEISQSDLEGWIYATGKDSFKIKVARGGNNMVMADKATVRAIMDTIRGEGITVANFDPLINLHAIIENNNNQLAEVAEQFGDIAGICECSIDLTHHSRKILSGENERETTSDDSRGGGALRAAVRSMRVFNRVSKREAEDAGVPVEQRGFYFRVDHGKANYLPPAINSRWFQLVNVELLNGDDVGTVIPWTHPGAKSGARTDEAREKLAEDIYMLLLARLSAAGKTVSDASGRNYAPNLFSQEQEAKDARIGKAAFEDAQRRLFAAGRLRVVTEGTAHRRRQRVVAV
jgi:RecA-family ATPase